LTKKTRLKNSHAWAPLKGKNAWQFGFQSAFAILAQFYSSDLPLAFDSLSVFAESVTKKTAPVDSNSIRIA